MNAFHGVMKKSHSGQAIIIVLMICLVLGILVGAVINFQRGHVHLLSKSAKDYLSLCVAEAGINCVLAEMKADYQFLTHGNSFAPQNDWSKPAKHRPYLVGEVEGLELDHPSHGTYTGRMVMKKTKAVGEFKVRVKLLSAKNSRDTDTVDEVHRYYLMEAVGKVDDSYRKITAVLEKYFPSAYLLYDEKVLDTGGYGPYRLVPGVLRRGRIYGHEMIKVARRGMIDSAQDFLDMEKISTPGHITVSRNSRVSFRNGEEGKLKQDEDSMHPEKFNSFPEKKDGKVIGNFVLDGLHGGKSEKFPTLNPRYYRDAADPSPTMISPGCGFDGFSESKWRNPAKPNEVVYDIDFGWEYNNENRKVLLYSIVPLRIWGCPPYKSMTLFCEKDVYIAGDFNANPKNPQSYDIGYQDYTDTPENGTDKNGVAILSMGRIWFDYSQPVLFLRNELNTLIDYEIAMCLGGKDLNPTVLASVIFPPKFGTNSSDPRFPMTVLNFKAIAELFALPKEAPEIIIPTLPIQPALKELREYLSPSINPEEYKKRFCIRKFLKREEIIAKIGMACYLTGVLTKGERDSIIRTILNEAEKETLSDDGPDPKLGIWNAADRLFKMAATHPKTGFKMPEMTVNALLIDSAELNARWDSGDGGTKVLNEIGNITSKEARCFPFVGPDTRMILRHMGGKINLRTNPADVFLDGRLRSDNFVVRRNIWDSTFVRGGGDYFPRYPMAAFGLISWQDDASTASEFNSF